MSKEPTTTAIVTKSQAERIDRAKAYHAACLKAFGDQMGYAFLAGLALNSLRDEIEAVFGYGHFTKFREAHLGEIPNGSAYRYMDFQKKLGASFPTVGKVNLLANGELSPKERESLLEAVHEVADGKTLTQLYRDLGVIRQPKPPTGTGKKADLTVADGEPDSAFLTELAQDLLLCCHEDSRALEECDTAALLKFKPVLDAFNHRFNAVLKRRKTKH